ncbi:MAG: hypothetical protein FWJ74_08545 [Gemmatimonadota bacterium]
MNRFRYAIDSRREGFALALVLIVTLAAAGLAAAAATIGMNSTVVTRYYERQSLLTRVADEGLELARARLNADPTLYPEGDTIAVLESDAEVRDQAGNVIPGVRRTTYVGPLGVISGEYGVVGAVVSVARDAGGARVIRRLNMPQESFSRFAYFTDSEGGNIVFGGGDQIQGPLHSNDVIKISDTKATFLGPVSTARNIEGKQYGTFRSGYTEYAPKIPLPEPADLAKLKAQAIAGGTFFQGDRNAPSGQATTRIEFIAHDVEGDGRQEGFIRVYRSQRADWVVAGDPENNLRNSRNCGHWHIDNQNNVRTFVAARDHGDKGSDDWHASVTNSTRACYLGGADELNSGQFRPNDALGSWLMWTGPVSPQLNRPDASYLFPITRELNPDFKGVIFVDGDVAVSGNVRGRVTVAATGNIIIADDIRYTISPALGTCDDLLGLVAGGSVIVAYTPINSPWRRGSGQAYFAYDDTDEGVYIDGFILTLNTFTVQNYDRGPTSETQCDGTRSGRGCLFVTGGIIQKTRGAVGQQSGKNALTGYVKRYSYDSCGATEPPPYFPTTGRFSRGTYYEVNPTGFDPVEYFKMLRAGT